MTCGPSTGDECESPSCSRARRRHGARFDPFGRAESLRGDVHEDSRRRKSYHERGSAERDERKRDTRNRQHVYDRADVDYRLTDDPERDADREHRRSGQERFFAARRPSHPRQRKRARTMSAPTRPVSSPMTEKMKSVCGFGNRPHFSRPAPRPSPYSRPEPIPTRDWTTW